MLTRLENKRVQGDFIQIYKRVNCIEKVNKKLSPNQQTGGNSG